MSAIPAHDNPPGEAAATPATNPHRDGSKLTHESLKALIDDDSYLMLRQHFLKPPGNGQPKALPSEILFVSNRLLVQLFYLKEEDQRYTFADLQGWLCKLVPTLSYVTKSRITHQVMSVHKSCLQMTEQAAMTFLDKEFDFYKLPQPLSSLGLNRLHLLDVKSFVPVNDSPINVTNAIVRALESFKVQENLHLTFVVKWIKTLDSNCPFSDIQLRSKVVSVCKKIRSYVKNKKTTELDTFLSQSLYSPSKISHQTPNAAFKSEQSKHTYAIKTNTAEKELRKANEMLETKIDKNKIVIDVLKEERNKLRQDNEKLCHAEKQLKDKTKESKKLFHQLKERDEQLEKMTKSRTYKANVSLRKGIDKVNELNNGLCKENESLKYNNEQLQKKLKGTQKSKSKLKRQYEVEKEQKQALLEEFQSYDHESDSHLNLKDSKNNKYKESVRIAYMDLQGRTNIAASKCSQVVKIVGKHFFGHEYDSKELPCSSTVLNFADEAHHISMHQVVDQIKQSDHYTYASDGTSRQKKQYLERHVILADKTQLSIGFKEIASDDAKTLLEQTIEMLHELTDIYSFDESQDKDEIFRELIKKMKCLMSDRAAVNKSFNKQMSQFRQDCLGENVTTHFLYCNAHFLLGLAQGARTAVKEVEEEVCSGNSKDGIGRDVQEKFSRFHDTEPAALRLIRLAADSLGPRCDEKSGSRAEWLAYCDSNKIISRFSSFRNNRFNNLFDNAAATVFHHLHIKDFLNNYCTHSNLKLQSVVADASDENVMALVGAIALFNVLITGSYWKLMNSYIPYGEFPQYVKKLDSALDQLSSHGVSDSTSIKSVFDEYEVEDDATRNFFLNSSGPFSDVMMRAVKSIANKSHAVLKRQLTDFLDGGIYGGPLDEETQQILNTCPLTNLAGERLFGDMDYDMLRRRHATTHHRSSVTMWKHNATSQWLERQGKEQRTKIMNSAVKNRKKLRKKHLESVRQVRETIKAKLKENEQKMKEKDLKTVEMKTSILDCIIADGGVCKTKEQLDELCKSCTIDSLKTQIRYRKVFLHQNHLRLTGTRQALYLSLLNQIEEEGRRSNDDVSSTDEEMDVDL